MNDKCVIILRGLPGCGKSRLQKRDYPAAVVVSADQFFMVEGEYRFNSALLMEAHGACFRTFISALQAGEPLVVVDNTAIGIAEIAPYVLGAQAYGYDAEVITLRCDPATAAARNTHVVPVDVILKRIAPAMAQAEKQIPPWWQHRVVELG